MDASRALLIVDVQVGAFDGIKAPVVKNAELLIDNIRRLIAHCRHQNISIIYIQDCGKIGGAFEEGTKHWAIHPEITPRENDIIIKKKTANAFLDTALKETLESMRIKALVLCGLHSEGCFTATCTAALALGFKTLVVEDAHSTAQDNYLDVIERQNSFLKKSGASIQALRSILTS